MPRNIQYSLIDTFHIGVIHPVGKTHRYQREQRSSAHSCNITDVHRKRLPAELPGACVFLFEVHSFNQHVTGCHDFTGRRENNRSVIADPQGHVFSACANPLPDTINKSKLTAAYCHLRFLPAFPIAIRSLEFGRRTTATGFRQDNPQRHVHFLELAIPYGDPFSMRLHSPGLDAIQIQHRYNMNTTDTCPIR